MIELKFTGSPEVVRNEMAAMLQLELPFPSPKSMPATSATNLPSEDTEETSAPVKERRKRRTKAEMEAEAKFESDEDVTAPAEAGSDSAPDSGMNYLSVKAVLKQLIDTGEGGTKEGFAILKSFGVEKISALKESDYARFTAKVQSALGSVATA